MSPKGQGSSQQAPQYAPRPYVPYNPHLTSDGSESRAAKSGETCHAFSPWCADLKCYNGYNQCHMGGPSKPHSSPFLRQIAGCSNPCSCLLTCSVAARARHKKGGVHHRQKAYAGVIMLSPQCCKQCACKMQDNHRLQHPQPRPIFAAAKPGKLEASIIQPRPAMQPPLPAQTHRREQQYYKPPIDRNPVFPPLGPDAIVAHASQQPLPRSDSNDGWGSEAPVAAGNAPSRSNSQVPFVQQQQNKQQPPLTHGQKPVIRAAVGAAAPQQAQQRLNTGQGAAPRAGPASQQGASPRRDQAAAAPALEAAVPSGWTCPICTYRHEDKQAGFLACAVCGSVRKET